LVMKKTKKQPVLSLTGKTAFLKLTEIDYLGGGAYQCRLLIESSGFCCNRPFGFDNDEYFVSKAKDVINTGSAEADLMDLQADSYIRLKPFENTSVLVSGYIVEETDFTQSIEFAFTVSKQTASQFVADFEQMVRSNI
jgi:hypothetical protein